MAGMQPLPASPGEPPVGLTRVKCQEAGEARHLGRLPIAACRKGSRQQGGARSQ